MVIVETKQKIPIQLTWKYQKSLDQKLNFLNAYFGIPLDEVPFWKLYKTVKKLNS